MIKQNWRNQTLLGVFSGITHNGEYFSVFFNFSSFTTDGFHTNSQDWFHDEWTFCRKKAIYLPGAHHAISWKTQFSESAACLPQFDVLRNCVSSIFSRRIYPSLENRYIQVNASSKNILSSWSLINISTSCIIMIIIKYTSWHYDHHKSMHLLSYTIMVITNLCIIMTIIQVYIFADRFSSLL